MQARMKNPAFTVPNLMQALQAAGEALTAAGEQGGITPILRKLIHTRASQINGCAVCVDMHSFELKYAGETDERIFALPAWREAPFYSAPERAALALTEAATRLSDRADAVPDEVWNEAAKHFDEPALAALVAEIAMINFWNRLGVTTRQLAGTIRPRAR